ncbi:MAG: hypothetical protein V4760_04690 [Bdellovibrionota bacterium]
MSKDNRQHNGKSPYRGNSESFWARGKGLVIIVVVLMIGTVAWITSYTRALQTTEPTTQSVDPARR